MGNNAVDDTCSGAGRYSPSTKKNHPYKISTAHSISTQAVISYCWISFAARSSSNTFPGCNSTRLFSFASLFAPFLTRHSSGVSTSFRTSPVRTGEMISVTMWFLRFEVTNPGSIRTTSPSTQASFSSCAIKFSWRLKIYSEQRINCPS